MKPEGPSNAGVVIVKIIAFGWIWVALGWVVVSTMISLQFGVPLAEASRRFQMWFGTADLGVVVLAVVTSRWARMVSAEIPLADKERFIGQATEALIKYQCRPVSTEGNTLTFRMGFPQSTIYDSLCINVQDGQARIVGPMYYVRHVLRATGGRFRTHS